MTVRFLTTVVFAAILAVLSALPVGRILEREIGLGLLYALRGDLEPPGGAVVVALDKDSIDWLQRNARAQVRASQGLSDCLTPNAVNVIEQSRNINQVPRALYVCLLRRLADAAPRYIVFDINFNADRPDDADFARAIGEAGNVLLLTRVTAGEIVRRLEPTRILRDAALGHGFFQTDGAADRVATGYPTTLSYAADLASLPVKTWQLFHDDPAAKDLSLPSFQSVWYYGPAKTIPTYSIRDLFDPSMGTELPDHLGASVVFVGASDPSNPGSYDHFKMPSVLERARMIGGVEIGATAFLNLLHDHSLTTLPNFIEMVIIFIFSIIVLNTGILLPTRPGFIAVPLLGAGYLIAAAYIFSSMQIWMPIAIPVVLGLPAALVVVILVRYSVARWFVRRLAPRQIAQRYLDSRSLGRGGTRKEEATVLFIDVEGSSSLGEQIDLGDYQRIFDEYYEAAASAIEKSEGMIIDFKGDGILAIFSDSVAGGRHATRACDAALEVSRQVDIVRRGWLLPSGSRFKLRIGLHSGSVATGAIGSRGRFNFNALGDVVNTAARLEEFGKVFSDDSSDVISVSGTTIENASGMSGAAEFVTTTTLRGRRAKTDIYRLRDRVSNAPISNLQKLTT